MAIRRKLIKIQLGSVDELIAVRKLLHGGGRGAPPIIRSGQRQGEAINKSCIVMLGAVLQAYVERVFRRLALQVFPHLNNPGSMDIFQKTYRRWGNPSAPNIVALFNKLAIDDVLENLSWRNCKNDTVRKRLIELNEMRNSIAHENKVKVAGQETNLPLTKVENYRNFAKAFAGYFEANAMKHLPKRAIARKK